MQIRLFCNKVPLFFLYDESTVLPTVTSRNAKWYSHCENCLLLKKKLTYTLPCNPEITIVGIYSREIKTSVNTLYTNVYSSIICMSPVERSVSVINFLRMASSPS